MNAIHIIMATSNSPFPHLRPNARIQSLATRRRISAITFLSKLIIDKNIFFYIIQNDLQSLCLVFGILLVIAGSLMASFQQQRFSVSVVVFGLVFNRIDTRWIKYIFFISSGISIIFAFMYWLSAQKILIALRKLDVDRIRVRLVETFFMLTNCVSFLSKNNCVLKIREQW